MHVLEAALFANLANAPRKAFSGYPSAERREIEKPLEAAVEAPARKDTVGGTATIPALFRRWFGKRGTRNCPAASGVAMPYTTPATARE